MLAWMHERIEKRRCFMTNEEIAARLIDVADLIDANPERANDYVAFLRKTGVPEGSLSSILSDKDFDKVGRAVWDIANRDS